MGKTKPMHLVLLLSLAFILSGCTGTTPSEDPDASGTTVQIGESGYQNLPIRGDTYLPVMGSMLEITVYTRDESTALQALEAGRAKALELEQKLQNNGSGPENEIARLNTQGEAQVSDTTYRVIQWGLKVGEETGGLFNITLLPVLEAWGFNTDHPRVPDDQTLQSARTLTNPNDLQLPDLGAGEADTIQLSTGMGIDLGGIGKGYATQEIIETLEAHGVSSALVTLGGNVQVLHIKPEGVPFLIALANPYATDGSEGFTGFLQANNEAVITSGDYQNVFEANGQTYHHIIDPRTGYPAENGLDSVTVVSPDGMDADALATALFVMGPEEAAAFWQAQPDRFEAVFVLSDGNVRITEGLAGRYEADALPDPMLIPRTVS